MTKRIRLDHKSIVLSNDTQGLMLETHSGSQEHLVKKNPRDNRMLWINIVELAMPQAQEPGGRGHARRPTPPPPIGSQISLGRGNDATSLPPHSKAFAQAVARIRPFSNSSTRGSMSRSRYIPLEKALL